MGTVPEQKLAMLIRDLYLDCIRSVGGRGPENIYVKIYGNLVHINFSLARSPLENFIWDNFPDGQAYLTDLYLRIHAIIKERYLSQLKEAAGIDAEFVDFCMDLPANKFIFTLVLKN